MYALPEPKHDKRQYFSGQSRSAGIRQSIHFSRESNMPLAISPLDDVHDVNEGVVIV